MSYIYEIKDEKAVYYFGVYVDVMKFKMKGQFVSGEDVDDIRKKIYNKYFNLDNLNYSSTYFDSSIFSKIKSCQDQEFNDLGDAFTHSSLERNRKKLFANFELNVYFISCFPEL